LSASSSTPARLKRKTAQSMRLDAKPRLALARQLARCMDWNFCAEVNASPRSLTRAMPFAFEIDCALR
jgi:hypothetical protein